MGISENVIDCFGFLVVIVDQKHNVIILFYLMAFIMTGSFFCKLLIVCYLN